MKPVKWMQGATDIGGSSFHHFIPQNGIKIKEDNKEKASMQRIDLTRMGRTEYFKLREVNI
jgi:hypothetical protein